MQVAFLLQSINFSLETIGHNWWCGMPIFLILTGLQSRSPAKYYGEIFVFSFYQGKKRCIGDLMLGFTFGWLRSTAFFMTCLSGSHGLRLGILSHIVLYKQWWQWWWEFSLLKQWTDVHLVLTVFTQLAKRTVVCSRSIKYLKFSLSFETLLSVVRLKGYFGLWHARPDLPQQPWWALDCIMQG